MDENGKMEATVRLKFPLRPERLQGRERITGYVQDWGSQRLGNFYILMGLQMGPLCTLHTMQMFHPGSQNT